MVAMGNLFAQKGGRMREMIEGRSCELAYPPPYSPGLTPIEQAFLKVKGITCGKWKRKHASRRSRRWAGF